MPKPKPSPESYRKPCSLCHKPRDVLVRCQIDESIAASIPTAPTKPDHSTDASTNASKNKNNENDDDDDGKKSNEAEDQSTTTAPLKPNAWHFVCPGACWKRVSGGVIDGDLAAGREGYRYGGMWKNKHAGVSAKVPRRLKGRLGREGGKGGESEGEEGKEGETEGSEKGERDGEEEEVR